MAFWLQAVLVGPVWDAALSCDGVARGLGLLSRCFGVTLPAYRPRATRFAQRRPNDPASKRADNETRANETRESGAVGATGLRLGAVPWQFAGILTLGPGALANRHGTSTLESYAVDAPLRGSAAWLYEA